jgi:hypothetical protein
MTLREISQRHDEAMRVHSLEQHNSHVWCWLVEMLRRWGAANPITIVPNRVDPGPGR